MTLQEAQEEARFMSIDSEDGVFVNLSTVCKDYYFTSKEYDSEKCVGAYKNGKATSEIIFLEGINEYILI